MKSKIKDCIACRKAIYKEAETAYLKEQYRYFSDSAYTMACYAVCGVLTALKWKGRSKAYIKKTYEDMCLLFNTPEIFGEEISLTSVMKQFEKEYEIDWSLLTVNIETEKHYITSVQKGTEKK